MKWFNDLKIRSKFLLGFLFVFFISCIIGVIGFINISSLESKVIDLYTNRVVPIEDLTLVRKLVIEGKDYVFLQNYADSIENDTDYMETFNNISAEIKTILDEYRVTYLVEDEKINLAKFDEVWKEYSSLAANSNISWGSFQEFRDSRFFKLNSEAIGLLTTLVEVNSAIGDDIYKESIEEADNAISLIIYVTIFCFALALSLGLMIGTAIKKPIQRVLWMAQEMQKGHVKVRSEIITKDEIGQMAQTLDKFVTQVDDSILGALKSIARGDVDFIAPAYDDKDEIAPELNKTTQALKALVSETNMLIKSAVDGNLKVRGNADKFEGAYNQIISGINSTLDAVILPVQEGSRVLEKMSAGDLTVRVEGDYKNDHQLIKNSINVLGESLSIALREVNDAAHAASSASTEISSSTEEMAAGAEEQSQQAQEVASAIDQMSKTILDSTKNASLAAEASKKSGDIAREGGLVIEETINGMIRIAEVVEKSAQTVQKLGVSSNQIGEIIEVIDDIADQTNLLALNAAIEAARAGEQGRGFAVVADEVRKLAERTTKATKEIAQMIKLIQSETTGAVKAMEDGKLEVIKGKELADKSGESLNQIIVAATNVVDIITQVAAASEEQSSASEQISKSIEGISSVTQQNSAGTQQIAKSAEDLNHLTENLQSMISKFTIDKQKKDEHYFIRQNGKLVTSN